MNEEAVEPQDTIEQIIDEAPDAPMEAEADVDHEQQAYEKTMIPLSALQKVREKKKELELELQFEKQRNAQLTQAAQKPAEDDNSRFESATREDLKMSQGEIIRVVEERTWIKNNAEKFEYVDQNLKNFLQQRPNLTSAIRDSANRYEEAYTLMTALSPKQQQQFTKPVTQKKEAPNSPSSVPKAAAMNESIDLMNMNDKEFADWRASKRKRR